MNCIRYEMGGKHARYVFIQDKNAPKFNPSAQFYAGQLNKGVMANVFKDWSWGSYRHLHLEQQNTVRTEHAYINVLRKNNLNSLTWIQSPLQALWSNASSNKIRCNIYYAAINTR